MTTSTKRLATVNLAKKSVAAGLAALAVATALWAADGDLDPNFGTAGVTKVPFTSNFSGDIEAQFSDARTQADGSILLAGYAELQNDDEADETLLVNYNNPIYIARLSSNGTVMGAPVSVLTGDATVTYGAKVTADNKVLVFGNRRTAGAGTTDGFHFGGRVARLSAAGVVEAEFIHATTANFQSSCDDAIVDAAGKIVVACVTFSRLNPDDFSNARLSVLRLNADLTADMSFGGDGFVVVDALPAGLDGAEASSIIQDSSGNYVVTGAAFDDAETVERTIVTRITNAGVVDTNFGTGGLKLVEDGLEFSDLGAVAIDDSGRIYLCGEGETSTDEVGTISRLTSTGATDVSFDGDGTFLFPLEGMPNGEDSCNSVAVVGQDIYANGSQRMYRLTAAGAFDPTFNSAATAAVGADSCTSLGGFTLLDNFNALILGYTTLNSCAAMPQPSTIAVGKVTLVAVPPDTTPNPFTFTDVTGAAVSTATTSNSITVAGTNAAAAISISGSGTYSINNGVFTAAVGTVNSGDTVRVRLSSSALQGTTVASTLSIGGVSDTFTVATAPANGGGGGGGGGGAMGVGSSLLLALSGLVALRRRKRD